MLRRPPTSSPTGTDRGRSDRPDRPAPSGAGDRSAGPASGTLLSELATQGWLTPWGSRRVGGALPQWCLVGTVASPTATPVDPAGLVVRGGWSLDWWVGADDRWRLPAREASVRQALLGDAPVVETVLRVPGGDAAHRAYGLRSPRATGDEWVVVEVENRTSVPFATVLVIRPFVADGVGSVGEITLEPVAGGQGRDVAHLVRIDGRPGLLLPRRPSRLAAGGRATGDVVQTVTSGAAGTDLVGASCPDGLATLALVFPTPHTAVLRVALPVGDDVDGVDRSAIARTGGARPDGTPADRNRTHDGDGGSAERWGYPQVLPDAPTVVAGWSTHGRGPRLVVPDQKLVGAFERARAHILLAHDGQAVRRDGRSASDMELGATDVLLGALDLLDRPADVGAVAARWVDRLASAEPDEDAMALAVVSHHWLVHRADHLLEWMLPEVSAAVERISRAHKRGRISDPVLRWRMAASLTLAARMLVGCGQSRAARAVADLAVLLGTGSVAPPAGPGDPVVDRMSAAGAGALQALVAEGGPTSTWPGPGPGSRPIGHDLAASAALVTAVRNLLVAERYPELHSGASPSSPDHEPMLDLALLPELPPSWYGGGIEVHDLPTHGGRISYGIRWHGIRPALLWHLEPHPGSGPVRLTVPGLDPTWSTTALRGDALLGEVLPPDGLRSLTVVAEHPDIDPVMRRPGTAPAEVPPALSPEGGSFS